MLVCSGNHLFIADGATGLNDAADTGSSSGIDTVTEGEEGIGCHHRTFHDQAFIGGLDTGDFGAVDPAHLTCAHPYGHAVFGINNGVGLNELGDLPTEQQIFDFFGSRLTLADHLEVGLGHHA